MNVQTIEKLNNIEDSNEEINNPKDNDNMEDSIEEINDSIETESSNEYSFFEQVLLMIINLTKEKILVHQINQLKQLGQLNHLNLKQNQLKLMNLF